MILRLEAKITAVDFLMLNARPTAALLSAVTALLILAAVPALSQQPAIETSVRVTVKDPQSLPVAGATCSLHSSVHPGKPSEVATDEQGTALFSSVSPGNYTLLVQKEGFAASDGTPIQARTGVEAETQITLQIARVSESVTVNSGESSNGVESGASTPSGNISRQSMTRLPLATKRIDDALPLVPGVVRSTTGEISIKGAPEQQSALLVNGLNASDPATGNFRLNLPVDSVEEVQVFQHPYTAEFGEFTGGLTRVETRRGGDQFHFEINDFLPDPRFIGGKIVGIAADTPRLNFNGPLIANRLFISQSFSYSITKRPVRGLTFPANVTTTETESSFTQIDYLRSSRHTESFTFGVFPERDQYVGLDFFRPQPVTPNYRQRDYMATARDNFTLAGGLLETSVSFKRFNANVWGQGTAEEILTPTAAKGNYFATQDRQSNRFEFLEFYTLPRKQLLVGSHEFKFGFDFNNVSNRLVFQTRPVDIVRADGSLAESTIFDQGSPIHASNREYVAFAQDRWLLRPNLSLDLGLRYEDQRIADETNVAPRAGFAWSPFSSDKTVVRGGIGLYYDKVPLNIRSFAFYPGRTIIQYAADGRTVIDQARFINVLVNQPPVPPLDVQDSPDEPGFVPENLTWNLQLDQSLTRRLMLRANMTESHTDHIYIVNPETSFNGQSAMVLRSAGQAEYRALELTARYQLTDGNPIYVSYVRSRARGDLNDFNTYFGDFANPIIRPNQFSYLPYDVPNRLLAWGVINLPRHLTLSPIFEARSGFPYSVVDQNQNFVGVRNADETRFPPFVAVDMQVAKDFQVTKKYGLRISVGGYNILNHFNPRDVRANLADQGFGQFLSPYRRFFSGGVDILF